MLSGAEGTRFSQLQKAQERSNGGKSSTHNPSHNTTDNADKSGNPNCSSHGDTLSHRK